MAWDFSTEPDDVTRAVFAEREGKAVRREVVAGARSGEWREVDVGLEETDSVILAGGQALEDGAPVQTAKGESQ